MSGYESLSVPPESEFFRSKWVQAPAGTEFHDPSQLPHGFRAGGVSCGIQGHGATDLGAVVCDSEKLASAILLTANAAAAAPIRVCRENLRQDGIRAVIVNSGNANAATGQQGIVDALAMRDGLAEGLDLASEAVAVAETGVIGVPLEMDTVLAGIPDLVAELGQDTARLGAARFSEAIMTTDKWPKRVSLTLDGVALSAQAKGAGMIEPGYATMLCFIQTDAVVEDPGNVLRQAVNGSFERITVDGQMSTNDTVLLQASGNSGRPLPEGLLDAVLLQLALEVVSDGEGASRVGRVEVSGAASQDEADLVARKIANSPLVKTALLGRDPNWGRIAQAAGQALAGQEIGELGPDVIEAGDIASGGREAELTLRLERGDARAHVFFSDLTHEYIVINAEYTT